MKFWIIKEISIYYFRPHAAGGDLAGLRRRRFTGEIGKTSAVVSEVIQFVDSAAILADTPKDQVRAAIKQGKLKIV